MTELIQSQEEFLELFTDLKKKREFLKFTNITEFKAFSGHFKRVLENKDVDGLSAVFKTIKHVTSKLSTQETPSLIQTLIKIKITQRVTSAKIGPKTKISDERIKAEIGLIKGEFINVFGNSTGESFLRKSNIAIAIIGALQNEDVRIAVIESNMSDSFIDAVQKTFEDKSDRVQGTPDGEEIYKIFKLLMTQGSIVHKLEELELFNKEVTDLLASGTLIKNKGGTYDKYLNAMSVTKTKEQDQNEYKRAINFIIKIRTSEDAKLLFKDSLANTSILFTIGQIVLTVITISAGISLGSGAAESLAATFQLLNGFFAPILLCSGLPGLSSRCLFWSMMYCLMGLLYAYRSIDISFEDSQALQKAYFDVSYNAFVHEDATAYSQITQQNVADFITEIGPMLYLTFTEQFFSSGVQDTMNHLIRITLYKNRKSVRDKFEDALGSTEQTANLENYVTIHTQNSDLSLSKEFVERYTLKDTDVFIENAKEILEDIEGKYSPAFKAKTREHLDALEKRVKLSVIKDANTRVTKDLFTENVLKNRIVFMYFQRLGPYAVYLLAMIMSSWGNIKNMIRTEGEALSKALPFIKKDSLLLKVIAGILLFGIIGGILYFVANFFTFGIKELWVLLPSMSTIGNLFSFWGDTTQPIEEKEPQKVVNTADELKLTQLFSAEPWYMYLNVLYTLPVLYYSIYYGYSTFQTRKNKAGTIKTKREIRTEAINRIEKDRKHNQGSPILVNYLFEQREEMAEVTIDNLHVMGNLSIQYLNQSYRAGAIEYSQSSQLAIESRKTKLSAEDVQRQYDRDPTGYKQKFLDWFQDNKNRMTKEAKTKGLRLLQPFHNTGRSSTRFRFT
jgi:hypothetical protein